MGLPLASSRHRARTEFGLRAPLGVAGVGPDAHFLREIEGFGPVAARSRRALGLDQEMATKWFSNWSTMSDAFYTILYFDPVGGVAGRMRAENRPRPTKTKIIISGVG